MASETDNKPLTTLDTYRILSNSGLRVSPLSLGTMTFGQDWNFGNNAEESRKVFDLYRSKGGNFFDTANGYTNGTSERYLGEYIQGIRSQVVVATKFTTNPDAALQFSGVKSKDSTNPNGGGNHKKSLVENLDLSLRRLRLDSVDILYVHFWEFSTPVDQVMRNLDDVVRSGKAYHVAVSDTPAWLISKANTLADLRGWSPFVGLQTRYNLIDRSFEFELGPMARTLNIGTMPWGCLAEGFLTGKHKGKVEEGSGRSNSVASHLTSDKNQAILAEVERIAAETGQTPAAVSLNWLLQKPGVTSPIVGARNVEQLESNLKALDFTLTPQQMHALDTVSAPAVLPFPNNFIEKARFFADGAAKINRPPLPY